MVDRKAFAIVLHQGLAATEFASGYDGQLGFSFFLVWLVVIGLQSSGKKESILDLSKFVDKGVKVKMSGGREVTGTLKGYDQLLNLVLDDAVEHLRDPADHMRQHSSGKTRKLGLTVSRGTSVMCVSPLDGLEEISNPFVSADA